MLVSRQYDLLSRSTLPLVVFFQRHPACKGATICDDIFVVAPLQEALALVAEHKLILKQPGRISMCTISFVTCSAIVSMTSQARELFQNTSANRQNLSDLAEMDAGVPTKGLRVV